MPTAVCAECGLEAVGPALMEDEAFLCCDCDVELLAYSAEERADPQTAGLLRGHRASTTPSTAASLVSVTFAPDGSRPLALLSDPEESIFAGVGTRLWPAAEPLARYLLSDLASVVEAGLQLSVIELGAGVGAVGLWLWKALLGCLRLCLTDVPRLCPLMQMNADKVMQATLEEAGTDEAAQKQVQEVSVRPLRWGLPEDLAVFAGERWDFLVGSDICYSEEKVIPLMDTVAQLRPRLGAVFCLSLDDLRKDGARALAHMCGEASWIWQELTREHASDDAEVMLVRIAPPSTKCEWPPSLTPAAHSFPCSKE